MNNDRDGSEKTLDAGNSGGQFADWDAPANAAPQSAESQTDSAGDVVAPPSPSAPVKLFLDSPVYSIDNYRKLAHIKNTFAMVHFINIILGGIAGIILFVFFITFIYYNRRLPSSEAVYILITVILSIIALTWVVYQYLPKRRRTRPILLYSIILYIIYAFALLIIYSIEELSHVSDEDVIVIISIISPLVLLVTYLKHRLSLHDDYIIELERSDMDISREEIQRSLSTIITDSDWSFWRINLSITPGSLSDKLENTLLSQLHQKKSISDSALTKMKDPSFLKNFIYCLKYPRFIVIQSIFAVSFYITAISLLAQFYDLEGIYGKYYGYSNSYYYNTPLYLDEDFIPIELIFFQLIYFAVIAMLRRKPVAAIYAYRINTLIFCFLVIALHLFVFLLPNQGFKRFISTGEAVLFFSTVIFAAFLPILLTFLYVRSFPKALRKVIESGVSPLYYDLRLVRDAYLMIAGYQRHVENADEDGWE